MPIFWMEKLGPERPNDVFKVSQPINLGHELKLLFLNPTLSLLGDTADMRVFLTEILGLASGPTKEQPGHFECGRAIVGVSSDHI